MLRLFLITLVFFPFFSVLATDSLDVVINEIAWMGTKVSYNDEWIELYNNTNKNINLNGWILKTEDETPNITLVGTILAKDFFLLERTNDNTLPDITADQIYQGSLENSGENLGLYDNLGNLIDSVDCSFGWFTGNNKTKQTMERKDPKLSGSNPNNWQTSQNHGGTPNAKNDLGEELTKIGPVSAYSQETPVTYPTNIFINEILPSPEGSDAKGEWIEIFNQNNFKVNLSGWKIKDEKGRIKEYTFPENTEILPEDFLVIHRSETKITLNNGGDCLNLIHPNGTVTDKVCYEKAVLNQSYNQSKSGWVWSTILTPNLNNKSPELQINSLKEATSLSSKIEAEENIISFEERIYKDNKSEFPILYAFLTVLFSGTTVLILKRKLKNLKNKLK